MTARSPSRRFLLASVIAALPLAARAQGNLLDQGRNLLNQGQGSARGGGGGGSLSQDEIGAGLKEALRVAARKVVGQVGKSDGYFADPAIRIPLPGPLQQVEGALKAMGGSTLLDDLHMKMNRAAEQAAPKALNIFTDAATKMSIADARSILSGPKDAATQYFKRTTTGALTTSFRPIVDQSLSGVGAASAFKAAQTRASGLPLAGRELQTFSLTDFTVEKALDGLFYYIGVEEAAIRTNPAARSTDLLKKVFS